MLERSKPHLSLPTPELKAKDRLCASVSALMKPQTLPIAVFPGREGLEFCNRECVRFCHASILFVICVLVHASGKPFDDPSGDRLRDWLGLSATQFYDTSRVAIVPMAFCFPGYDSKGSDLPPPPVCRATWHDLVMQELAEIRLSVIVGGYAQKYHLRSKAGVTETVRAWRDHAPRAFPLPHPSWRNTAWLKRNPWFAQDVLPALRARVKEVLND